MSERNFRPKLVATLVVCTANICRSPTASFALSQFSSLSVQSTGLRAEDGTNICPTVADRLSKIPGGSKYVEEFFSQSIGAVDLQGFELILTATSSIRGALVQKYPELRDRTFTLLESRQLVEQSLSPDEAEIFGRGGTSAVLIRRRGTLPTLASKPRWLRGSGPSPLDLVDTHGMRSQARHRRTIDHALQAGAGIGEALTRWGATQK